MEWFTKWVKIWKVCNVGEEMERFAKSVNICKVCNMGEKMRVKRWKVCNMGGEMKVQGDWRRPFVKKVVQQGVRERKLTRKRARTRTLGAELDHLVRTLDFMRSFFFDFLATIVVVVDVAATAAGERSSSVAV
jgi:hypothetical protein